MNLLFALSSAVAVAATAMVVTRRNAVHALLYLIVSLIAVALDMLLLGAAFVAALEIIIYAGAIMVLFVFVVMLIGPEKVALSPRAWIGPVLLGFVLLVELAWVLARGPAEPMRVAEVSAKQVGIALLGPYLLGAETAALILLAGLVGAFHLGRRRQGKEA
jgi:NADH-quinone oxidoreductase subunit J